MAELKIVDHQTVGPMEASFVAQGNQRRIDTAEPVIELLASMRAKTNQHDNAIEREAALLNGAWLNVKEKGLHKYEAEFSNRTYWLTMLGVMAVETPLNQASLDFARLPIWEGWLVAAGFGLLNFFGAKSAGRVLRQAKVDVSDWRQWFIATAVTSVLALALTQFALLRQLDPNPAMGSSAGAFLALQATFFVIVAAVTFFHVDPDPEREQLHRRIERGQKVLEATWKARVSLAKAYNAKRAKIALKLASIEEDTNDRVAQYRTGNMLKRAKEDTPSFMTRSLGNVWTPVPLPSFVDEEPLEIRELVGRPTEPDDAPDNARQPSGNQTA